VRSVGSTAGSSSTPVVAMASVKETICAWRSGVIGTSASCSKQAMSDLRKLARP
jgi:hypothetical protein